MKKRIPGPDGTILLVEPRGDIRAMSHLFELRVPGELPRFYRLGPEERAAGRARDVTDEVTGFLVDGTARARRAATGQRRATRRRLGVARARTAAEWQRVNDPVETMIEEVPENGASRVRRLRSDVVERLHRRGGLTLEQVQAAEAIRAAWAALTRGLFMSARRLDAVQVDGGRQYRDPLDRMHEREVALVARYKVFADWAGGRPVRAAKSPQLTLLQLTIDMLVDNLGPSQVERLHGLRNGSATGRLAEALDAF